MLLRRVIADSKRLCAGCLAATALAGCADDKVAASAAADLPEFCAKLPRAGWAAYEKLDLGDPWFEVYRLAGDLYAITEPYQWQEVISYLIIGETSAIIFDTGNGIGDIRAVVDKLTTLPVTALASHSHIDHVGGHWQFDAVLAPDTPFTEDRAKGRPNSFVREEASAAALCKALPAGVTEDNHHTRAFAPTGRVAEGTLIDLGGLELKVLAAPGHTPDAIALMDRANGRLFTGDTYYKGPIWLYAPETDLDAYGTTIARLADFAPSLTAVHGAHNEPFSEPGELIRVRNAFAAIRAGEVEPAEVGDGQVRYEFESFGFLMSRD